MAVYFNDLTIVKNDPQQNCRLLPDFWKVMKKLKESTEGREKRVYASKDANALAEAVFSSGDPEAITRFSTFFSLNYQGAEEHTGGEAEYIIDIESEKVECAMLGWAHHERSITLGLSASPKWAQLVYPIKRTTIEEDETVVSPIDSVCVTSESQIDTPRIRGWIAAQRDFEKVQLPAPSTIPISEKKIHYRKDHGQDVLEAFARRLVRCEYVDAVINSTEWRRHDGDQFVYAVKEDGIVELCLHWEEARYGLAVQTTARGVLQTQLVADVLREKFDRRS